MRGVRRGVDAQLLQIEVLVEALEEELAATEHDGCGRDSQLVDVPTGERLPDHVSTAAHRHVLVASRCPRQLDRPVEPVDEEEPGRGVGCILGAVRDDVESAAEGVGAAPRPGGVVHPAAHDPRADVGDHGVVVRVVLRRHVEGVLAVVGPRTAHHPVVQPLAADAQPALGSVVGSGDVAVDRGRDACDDLACSWAHVCLLMSPLPTVAARENSSRPETENTLQFCDDRV